jgi:hypothetical protein
LRLSPSTLAFSICRVASDLPSRIRSAGEIGPGFTLLVDQGHRGTCSALAGSFVNGRIDLSDSAIEVGYDPGLHRDAGIDVGAAAGDRQVTSKRAGDVGSAEIAKATNRVQRHQDGHEDG